MLPTMPPHGPPLRLQLLVHPGTAVALLARGVDGGDLDGEALRVPGLRRHRPRAPRIESGAGHLQDGTQAPHREVGLLLQDEGEPHPCSLTKKAVAFFRMSRSICNRFTSRRSRASSSRSSVVSAPARPRPASTSACRTQARSAVSVRSSSRAIVPRLFSLPCTNRTVSALNSGENDRRFLRLCFPMTPSYRTFVRVGVSTKPGQAQEAASRTGSKRPPPVVQSPCYLKVILYPGPDSLGPALDHDAHLTSSHFSYSRPMIARLFGCTWV